MSTRFISAAALPGWLEKMRESHTVLTPQAQGKGVVFAPYEGGELCLCKTHTSPKASVLPQCESLLRYHRQKQEDGSLTLAVDAAAEAPCGEKGTVIFGCRPCDARGIAVLDRPFLQGPYRDPYYAKKREALLVVTLACNSPCSTCFCHWVGSEPHDSEGSDVLMVAVDEGKDGGKGYVLKAVTEKGEEALTLADKAGAAGSTDGTAHEAAAAEAGQKARAAQGQAPDISAARANIAALFNNTDFWQKHTAACLSCGGCTYFCPACYCFNITDEGDGMGDTPGQRLRSWDNCMAAHFTREASGHNARTLKAQRMRNRVSHKFSNYPTVWDGKYSCTGCGRCISQCPVHLDIRAIVLAAVES